MLDYAFLYYMALSIQDNFVTLKKKSIDDELRINQQKPFKAVIPIFGLLVGCISLICVCDCVPLMNDYCAAFL